MSWDSIRSTIENRIKANWSTTPIEWPNIAFDPGSAAYIRPTILDGSSDRESMTGDASTGHQTLGILMINIFVPANSGSGTAYGYTDTLTTLFREQTVGTGGGRVEFGSQIKVSEGDSDDTQWFQLNFSIPFEHDEF